MTLVTLSAAYGTGGSRIGPEVARRLDATFLDRAIPAAVAERLAVPLNEATDHDEAVSGLLARMLLTFAPALQTVASAPAPVDAIDDRHYLEATEQVIREQAVRGNAVILGRAAAVVLRDEPRALHVRLTGPVERRIAQVMHHERVDRATAERRVRDNDRARDAYVRQFYRVDASDPSLYHLMIDATVLDADTVVDLIVQAARSRPEAALGA